MAVSALSSIRRPDLDHQLWVPGSSGASLSFGCNIFSPYWRERKGALRASHAALPSPFGLHGSPKIVHVTYCPLDVGPQRCKAAFHCLIVHGAEPVVALPMPFPSACPETDL